MSRPESSSPLRTVLQMALAVIAGGAQAASIAWPGPFLLAGLQRGQPVWWLQIGALALLAWLLQGSQSARQAALSGWLFGTAWLAATFGWTFIALHTYGGLPFFLAALAVFAFTTLLALFYAAACGLYRAVAPVDSALAAIVFAALWLLAELARGTWLTGFGWGGAGYAHVDGPLAGLARWIGVYGLGAVSAWLAMTLAQSCRAHRWRSKVTALALALLLLLPVFLPPGQRAGDADVARSTGHLSVTLLQGNIAQDEKFETGSGVPLALQWYAEQLQQSSTSLVIAPETAIPVLPQQLPPDYWQTLQQRFASGAQAALIGTPLGDFEQGYTNSVLGLKPEQAQPWRYDKQHLVPFGEFIPPWFKWFTTMMNIPLGDFNRGALKQEPFKWQGQKLAATVCYEDLFGEELARQFIDPALAPTLFVNVSNLAWFGTGLAIDQHLQIARMRSLEFERGFVLATNTGATAIVDHHARVTHALQRDSRAVLIGAVQGRSGITPYVWWVARLGLWPLWLLALGLILLLRRKGLSRH